MQTVTHKRGNMNTQTETARCFWHHRANCLECTRNVIASREENTMNTPTDKCRECGRERRSHTKTPRCKSFVNQNAKPMVEGAKDDSPTFLINRGVPTEKIGNIPL